MTPSLVAYGITLALHTYVRWAVLVVGLGAWASALHGVITARPWSRVDERFALAFVGFTDLQLLAGLLLHLWLSPISQAALAAGPLGSRTQPSLLFFGYVHPLLMIAGFIVAHATRARSKRLSHDGERFRTVARGLTLWLVLVLLAIPWPWMSYGRPLFRTGG